MTQASTHKDLEAIFVSVELSKKTWLVTSISPGGGEKLSRHAIAGGDIAGLLGRLAQLQRKVRDRSGRDYPFVIIQEAGLDGFWCTGRYWPRVTKATSSMPRPLQHHAASGG